MGYLFLLIANFAGISKVVAMKSSGKVCPGEYNSVRINTLRSLICLAVSVVIFAFSGGGAESEFWWIWMLSGLSNALMMFVWILCTQRVSLTVVETFSLLGSTAIPLALAPILYEGESVSFLQWVGVACLFVAVVLLSVKPKNKDAKLEKQDKTFSASTAAYLVLLIISNVGVSVTQKLYPTCAGQDYAVFFSLMTFVVVACVFVLALCFGKIVKGKSFIPDNTANCKKLFCLVGIAAVMIYLYQYCSTLAGGILPSAVFYPLSRGISMLLTVLCDVFVFKQKINKTVCVGLIFIFFSIVLTNL